MIADQCDFDVPHFINKCRYSVMYMSTYLLARFIVFYFFSHMTQPDFS